MVDHVAFGESRRGVTFTSDPITGAFWVWSRLDSASVATTYASIADDFGSPGRAPEPVSLSIVTQPRGLEVCLGYGVSVSVEAQGLPRPHYQWFHGDAPVPGATEATLSLPVLDVADAGEYRVEVSNGLQTKLSEPALITMRTQPQPPVVQVPPSDRRVTFGQPATFSVEVCAYPAARFQWSKGENRDLIIGATSAQLTVRPESPTSGEIYSVEISNELGTTSVSAKLFAGPKPALRITEAMALSSTNWVGALHADWWELTNFDTNSVDLFGYRWDDSAAPTLTGGATVTNHVVMEPGESVIFVEAMTREAFVRWWGAQNLPENLQVITYLANGLSDQGESITVWNDSAVEKSDLICQVDFTDAISGISFWFDPEVAFSGLPSVVGEGGAFEASEGGDIGSPGRISNPPEKIHLSVTYANPALGLAWAAIPNATYEIQSCENITHPVWKLIQRLKPTSTRATWSDTTGRLPDARFYRVSRL